MRRAIALVAAVGGMAALFATAARPAPQRVFTYITYCVVDNNAARVHAPYKPEKLQIKENYCVTTSESP